MLLLNQVNVGPDGLLVAVDELRTFIYGAAEGEHKVRISGITTRDFFYRTKYNSVKAVYQASEAMKNIGRRAHLQCMDNAAACIIKSPIFYPVVIVFYENGNGRMQLSAYTGRAFMSLFAINSALKKFDKELPDAMVRKVSIHSVHDVNMAIIHSIKRLANKDDGGDDREYVDLKKLFKSWRRRNRAPGYDRLGAEAPDMNESVRTESREERKARKKAERLEKKREAARRKYEKLMGIDPENSEADKSGASGMMNGGVTEGFEADDSEYIDNYSGEYPNEDNVDDEDILSEFTGLSRDELEALEEDDEDILSEFTGLSRDELEALEEDDGDILS